MAVTFPDNPVLNESYQAENGLTYVWDGEKWSSQGSYNIDNDNYIRKDGTNTVVYADNLGVGIGTTSPHPNSKLEVVGRVSVTATGADDAEIRVNQDGTAAAIVLRQTTAQSELVSSASIPMLIGTSVSVPLRFQTDGIERMSIRNTGNVGIGYLASDAVPQRLSVNGNTHVEGDLTVTGTNPATTVKVANGGYSTSNNRPIATFGTSASITGGSQSEIKYPAENPPVIKGDGTLKADAGVEFGASDKFRVNSIGKVTSLYTYNNTSSNSSNLVRVNSSGDFQRSTSSRRYKDNVRNLDEVVGGLDVILSLQPRQWEDHVSGETVTGLIAEEVHAAGAHLGVVWEELNTSVPHNGTAPITKDDSVAKEGDLVIDGVNDRGLILHLIEAVKELKAENDALKSRLDEAGA